MELDSTTVKEYFKKEGTVAEWWDPEEKSGLFRDLYVEQRKMVGRMFDPAGKLILDAGTGKGRFAIDFAVSGAAEVYATDLSEEMLIVAKSRAVNEGVSERVTFQAMDIENLSYRDDFFDVVCCMETFVHLPAPQTAMKELARVTKPGGIVIGSVTLSVRKWYLNLERVSDFGQLFEWAFTPIYESRLYQGPVRRVLGRPPVVGRPLSGEYFAKLFTDSGLSIRKSIYLGHPRAPRFLMLIADKPC